MLSLVSVPQNSVIVQEKDMEAWTMVVQEWMESKYA